MLSSSSSKTATVMTTSEELTKAINCSSTLSGVVAVEENGSKLTPHYMTGNENLNFSEMEKSETNYDTTGNKRLEGNDSIYDESDGVYVPQNGLSSTQAVRFNILSLWESGVGRRGIGLR